ncbi:MAG: restriction endonuclease subunit M [Fimbriimonadales bacterium]|nr:MAG: restriction endonuclease subunit M [Fimbriimonadales bacterium]
MRAGNTLYYGDNLKVMRQHIGDASVDLVYLDPPFNSQRDYNVLFREQSGEPAQGQIKAFTDTWQWSERAYIEFCETCPLPALAELMQGFVRTLGRNDLTAYLVMMAPRLVELHRALKPTGSLYLHCDPTASHYLKVMLDVIFGAKNFRNEIVWKRQSAHSDARYKFPNVADILLFYGKSDRTSFFPLFGDYDPEYLRKNYRYDDNDGRGPYRLSDMRSPNPRPNLMYEWMGYKPHPNGWAYSRETMQKLHDEGRIWYPRTPDGTPDYTKRPALKRYLNERKGSIITNIWTDVTPLHASMKERLGYPTQKPLALLERIIQASSNEGEVVLDPFCGCGTAIVAAHKLNRRWIGIDITHLAIALIKYRLSDMFDLKEGVDYRVIGEPTSVEDARALALQDRDEFQRWAIGLIPRAFPYQQKKGADTGIDGMLHFTDNPREHPKKVVIQVKSGRVGVKDIRDFRGVLEREGATLGLFVSLEPPTEPMLREAEQAGYYKTPLGDIALPRLQIRTVEQLLRGEGFAIPSAALLMGVAQAARAQPADEQNALDL